MAAVNQKGMNAAVMFAELLHPYLEWLLDESNLHQVPAGSKDELKVRESSHSGRIEELNYLFEEKVWTDQRAFLYGEILYQIWFNDFTLTNFSTYILKSFMYAPISYMKNCIQSECEAQEQGNEAKPDYRIKLKRIYLKFCGDDIKPRNIHSISTNFKEWSIVINEIAEVYGLGRGFCARFPKRIQSGDEGKTTNSTELRMVSAVLAKNLDDIKNFGHRRLWLLLLILLNHTNLAFAQKLTFAEIDGFLLLLKEERLNNKIEEYGWGHQYSSESFSYVYPSTVFKKIGYYDLGVLLAFLNIPKNKIQDALDEYKEGYAQGLKLRKAIDNKKAIAAIEGEYQRLSTESLYERVRVGDLLRYLETLKTNQNRIELPPELEEFENLDLMIGDLERLVKVFARSAIVPPPNLGKSTKA